MWWPCDSWWLWHTSVHVCWRLLPGDSAFMMWWICRSPPSSPSVFFFSFFLDNVLILSSRNPQPLPLRHSTTLPLSGSLTGHPSTFPTISRHLFPSPSAPLLPSRALYHRLLICLSFCICITLTFASPFPITLCQCGLCSSSSPSLFVPLRHV